VTEALAADNFTLHPNLQYMRRALLRCKGFGLYFARCNTPALRTELVATLKENITAPIIELTLTPENDIYIDAQMGQLLETAPENAIVFIYDIEKLFYLENRHLLAELNWRRGFYGRMNHPVVFWLPEFLLVELFNNSPDFMDWRSGVYEFSLSQPEQQNLMENIWQTVNESLIGSLSLQEKERWIVNLQNLLSELDGEESKTKADLLNRLGFLYASIGKYDKALDCYQQNLAIQQEIGYKHGEGATLNYLSEIAYAKGDDDSALRYLENSLKICQDSDNKQGEGVTLTNLSQIYNAKGDYENALRYSEQSLKIQQTIGDKQGEGVTLNNLSQIYRTRGDVDNALRYLEQALKIQQEIGDKSSESATLFNIGRIYNQNGDRHQAQLTWLKAYRIAKQIGRADALQHLEKLAKHLGGTGLDFWEKLSQENTQGK
jgi:tetratricopeptide (TPR) repeat protein